MKDKIVVIGNGIAGVTAVKSIREVDKNCEIHLFGEEKFYPYNRIRLSKGLVEKLEEDNILLLKKEWYAENNVELYVNKKVISIDTDNREIRISDGTTMPYSKLLISNGARDRVPPILGIEKEGVLTLRTLENAWRILENAKDSTNILNIGGGIQGLEIAWMLSQLGKKVTLVEIASRLMPRQLDAEASDLLRNAVEAQGINILLNTSIKELIGTSRVTGFITNQEKEYECDLALYSIGIQPNIGICSNTSINTNIGLLVNNKMESNVKDIYAAGDIAELDNHIYGLWNISIGHGKVAGYNIAGKNTVYEHIVPVTTLNAYNLKLFSMGDVHEDHATDIIIEKDPMKSSYKKVIIRDNKVIGAIVMGDIKSSPVLKTAIEKEVLLNNIDFENITFDQLIKTIKTLNKKNKEAVYV